MLSDQLKSTKKPLKAPKSLKVFWHLADEGADNEYRFGYVIQFSHYSVKEFLTSTRLAEATDNILRRYHVSMTPAHTLAAQACLGTLLHLDEDVVTRDSLEKWPLAGYAARHWIYHVRFEDVSQNVVDGLKQLFVLRTDYAYVLSQSIRAKDTERGFIYPIDKSLLCKMRSCTVRCAKLT